MKIALVVMVLLFTQVVSAYYIGWEHGVNATKYKEMIGRLDQENFENLTNIVLTMDDCVWIKRERMIGGYSEQCSKGIFKYWFNGRTTIVISINQEDDLFTLVLAHELGHLKQFSKKEFDFSQDGADEYAIKMLEGFK